MADEKINTNFAPQNQMVPIVQLVRTSDCGSEGQGFEAPIPPQLKWLSEFLQAAIFSIRAGLTPAFNEKRKHYVTVYNHRI